MLELQSKWIAKVLSRKAGLPSKEEMMRDVQEYYQQMTVLRLPKHLTPYSHNFEEVLYNSFIYVIFIKQNKKQQN